MSFIRPIFLALATTILLGFHAVESAQLTELEKLRQDSRVALALRLARDGERQTIADQVAFCETPAPPFEEKARGELLRRSFAQVGLRNVRTDREGNVLAERPGAAARPHVVLAAHLDTVFPKETDVRVKRDGVIMRGPGIGDNCRGLAVLVAVARAMQGGQVTTAGTVTFVANVGEEGLGDLRGVKELFGVQSGRDAATVSRRAPIDSFVSIDGPGYHVTHVGVGSRRYRVTFSGPGGHSFGDFGTPSAVTALCRLRRERRSTSDESEAEQPSTPFRQRHGSRLTFGRPMPGL
jgi:acetylornithine deacetylase/succinyl-diaminopimelate desuccinylase-like protein